MSHPNLTPWRSTISPGVFRRQLAEQMDLPVSLLFPHLPQPKKIRGRASRVAVRASRSLPYPDGKYERRRRQREANIDLRFDQFEADLDRRFRGKGNHERYALRMAVKGSGRRDIVD
jgi:hypothetical protein